MPPTFENTHDGLISSIQKLQEQEKFNLDRIKTLSAVSPTTPEIKEEIAKIEQIIKDNITVRKHLHQTLNALHTKGLEFNTNNSGTTAAITLINAINKELGEANHDVEKLRITKNNQNRLAQIKQFRKSKTEHIYEILKFITYCFLAILGVVLLRTMFLPVPIAQYAYIGIMSFCIIKVIWEIYDISIRDNLNYDRYNWPVDREKMKVDVSSDPVPANEDDGDDDDDEKCS